MANKTINSIFFGFFILIITFTATTNPVYAKKEREITDEIKLTDLNNLNITLNHAKDLKLVKNLLETKRPKAIYIEQWILIQLELEEGNKKVLQKLYKIAKKNDSKLFLFIGKDSWFGQKGLSNTIAAYNTYGNYVDGIVLKNMPNKTNIWRDDNVEFQAQVLNQVLDGYSAIHHHAKKINKMFIADFPFWFSDFKGPKNNFSQNVCDYVDRVIFLIDDIEKLENLDIKWNDITCMYNIDLTRKASQLSPTEVEKAYKLIKSKLSFYSNFAGFIIDSDSYIEATPISYKTRAPNDKTLPNQ